MRVRITRLPSPGELSDLEIDVSRYWIGEVYDVGPCVAGYLVLMGFGHIEMRTADRPAQQRSNKEIPA